jgi:hypothetical protein
MRAALVAGGIILAVEQVLSNRGLLSSSKMSSTAVFTSMPA